MKSPLTTSLRKQTPINKKAIPYMTANKSNFTYMKKVLFTVLLFMFVGTLFAQEQNNNNFKIKIKWVKNHVVFECDNGCGYQMSFNAKRTVVLDQFGMVNVQKNLVQEDTSDYQFSYTKKGDKIILKGIKGVSWNELKLDYKKEYTFDNNGLVGS